ncbi:MAG: YraN family protein [Pseudomonadota bacterium]|nr:YraN family protein [Pseudomonadota bacterium]
MSVLNLQRGAAAEQLAAGYLQARGMKILARNLRCKAGEIDLLCLETAILVVVEVRQRRHMAFGGAVGSVTCAKRRKIIHAAQFFMQNNTKWRRFAVRFDVIAVEGLPDGAHRIDWVKDAFRA